MIPSLLKLKTVKPVRVGGATAPWWWAGLKRSTSAGFLKFGPSRFLPGGIILMLRQPLLDLWPRRQCRPLTPELIL